jgi:hypothetical protein
MPTTPLLWLALCCEEWGTPRPLAERTWQSLMASRWTHATALRQWILVQPYVNPQHFCQRHSPQDVVEVLEMLVTERRLARHLATALEESLLTTVTATGAWREEKGTTHATQTLVHDDHSRVERPRRAHQEPR